MGGRRVDVCGSGTRPGVVRRRVAIHGRPIARPVATPCATRTGQFFHCRPPPLQPTPPGLCTKTPHATSRVIFFRGGGGTPCHIQHSPNTPTTGLRERGNDTSKSTGRSGRQNAATRRNMRRGERVTVQGPVKEQQPDGMSHRGGQNEHPQGNEGRPMGCAGGMVPPPGRKPFSPSMGGPPATPRW